MTHEGNTQVKETKALALIQKYEAFRMEEDESVETMFSRFQMLVAGLRVLDKGYSTSDHVKKIIRSLPKKWRPMVTALKVAKDLNQICLEELISSLRSHEIELQEDEPQRKVKSVALKSISKKGNAFQAEEKSEGSEEISEEEELSLISRRINHLWKHRQDRSSKREPRNDKYKFKSISSQRQVVSDKVMCFECKKPGHYRNECPSLHQDEKSIRYYKGKKGLVTTGDDSESEEEEVHSLFSHSELKACLLETIKEHNSLLIKHKILEKDLVAKSEVSKKYKKILSEASEKYEQTITELEEKNFSLESSNVYLRNKISKLEKEISSGGSDSDNERKYEKSFQYFLAKNVDRSKMASLIYGISNNNKNGLGYSEPFEKHKTLNKKSKALYEQFAPSGTHIRSYELTHSEGSRRQPQKRNKSSMTRPHAQIPLKYPATKSPKVPRTSGKKTNKRGPRKWVPKNKIIFLADILNSSIETPIMEPGQWMLATHEGRKAYVPRVGT